MIKEATRLHGINVGPAGCGDGLVRHVSGEEARELVALVAVGPTVTRDCPLPPPGPMMVTIPPDREHAWMSFDGDVLIWDDLLATRELPLTPASRQAIARGWSSAAGRSSPATSAASAPRSARCGSG